MLWWALTEGQYRPKAGKKKKTRARSGSFFSGSPFALVASSGSGLTQRSPTGRVYCPYFPKLYVDRHRLPGMGVLSGQNLSILIQTVVGRVKLGVPHGIEVAEIVQKAR